MTSELDIVSRKAPVDQVESVPLLSRGLASPVSALSDQRLIGKQAAALPVGVMARAEMGAEEHGVIAVERIQL